MLSKNNSETRKKWKKVWKQWGDGTIITSKFCDLVMAIGRELSFTTIWNSSKLSNFKVNELSFTEILIFVLKDIKFQGSWNFKFSFLFPAGGHL